MDGECSGRGPVGGVDRSEVLGHNVEDGVRWVGDEDDEIAVEFALHEPSVWKGQVVVEVVDAVDGEDVLPGVDRYPRAGAQHYGADLLRAHRFRHDRVQAGNARSQ